MRKYLELQDEKGKCLKVASYDLANEHSFYQAKYRLNKFVKVVPGLKIVERSADEVEKEITSVKGDVVGFLHGVPKQPVLRLPEPKQPVVRPVLEIKAPKYKKGDRVVVFHRAVWAKVEDVNWAADPEYTLQCPALGVRFKKLQSQLRPYAGDDYAEAMA